MSNTTFMSKAPLRLSMGGGGTDVESYYGQREYGSWTSAAISLYVRVTVSVNSLGGVIVKYSDKVEKRTHIDEIEGNALLRETLRFMRMDRWQHPLYHDPGIEINTFSDAPGKSGLGVSGAMTVSLLQILYLMRDGGIPLPQQIAEEAYHIEHDLAGSTSTGWQDQMIAAHAGVTAFEVRAGQKPTYEHLALERHVIAELESNLILFGTRLERAETAEEALRQVHKPVGATTRRASAQRRKTLGYLDQIREIGERQKQALLAGEVREFGRLLHKHWEVKTSYAGSPDPAIAKAYEEAMDAGALGGKVVGASSKGAFMMFYCPYPKEKGDLRRIMSGLGMVEIPWAFEFEGSSVVYVD